MRRRRAEFKVGDIAALLWPTVPRWHNCEIGNRVIMSNNATLVHHVTVGGSTVLVTSSACTSFGAYWPLCNALAAWASVTHNVPSFLIQRRKPVSFRRPSCWPKAPRCAWKQESFLSAFSYSVSLRWYRFRDALCIIENELRQLQGKSRTGLTFAAPSKRGLIDHAGVTAREKGVEDGETAS